jgi:hypothetical protein
MEFDYEKANIIKKPFIMKMIIKNSVPKRKLVKCPIFSRSGLGTN